MPLKHIALLLAPLVAACAAPPLPELRTEPVPAGSVFTVKNTAAQPLAAFLIELVNYPGSSYWLFRDDASPALASGAEERIPVTNMTVGAAPEYVKITAALYADGSSAGDPGKVALIVERRKTFLDTTREAIRRIEQARQSGTDKGAIAAGLKQWAESLQPQGKSNRLSLAVATQAAARAAVSAAAAYLERHSIDETLANLRALVPNPR
jgi:hypothetical protein